MGLCEKCSSIGLPIFPVRYAVAPKRIKHAGLPSWAKRNELFALANADYVLRNLHAGYVYLLYEKLDGEANQWEAYTTDNEGYLWKQVSARAAQPPHSQGCESISHNPAMVGFICIKNPELHDKVWIAFSGHKWSNETLQQYIDDEALRNKRMQLIEPIKWKSSPNEGSSFAPVTESNITSILGFNDEQVIDLNNQYGFLSQYLYSDEFGTGKPMVLSSSNQNKAFEYKKELFKQEKTISPWRNLFTTSDSEQVYQGKKTRSEYFMQAMKSRSTMPPMMMALWDSVGIADELSAWVEVLQANTIKVYTERKREIGANQFLKEIEILIKETKKGSIETKLIEREIKQQQAIDSIRESALKTPHLSGFYSQLADYLEQAKTLNYPGDNGNLLFDQGLELSIPLEARFEVGHGQVNLYQLQKELKIAMKSRDMDKSYQRVTDKEWRKYQNCINKGYQDQFNQAFDEFITENITLSDPRVQDALSWLNQQQDESHLFTLALNDFSKESEKDQIGYTELISKILTRLVGSSKAIEDYMVKQLAEFSVSDTNLVWNILTYHNKTIQDLIKPQLDELKQNQPLEVKDNNAFEQWMKGTEKIKKLAKVFNTINKAFEEFEPSILNSDQLFLGFVPTYFRQSAVYGTMNEYFVKLILAMRMGLSGKVESNIRFNQFAYGETHRDNLARSNPDTFKGYYGDKTTPIGRSVEITDESKQQTTAKRNALIQQRIVRAILLFEIIGIIFLMNKEDEDKDLNHYLQLTSGISSSIALTMRSLEISLQASANDNALKIKGINTSVAAFGLLASVMNCMTSVDKFRNSDTGIERYTNFTTIIVHGITATDFLKTIVGKGSIQKVIYALANVEVAGAITKVITSNIARKAVTGIFTVALSWQFALAWFVFECLVSLFEKNELEKWLLYSRFGENHYWDKGYKTEEEELAALKEIFDKEETYQQSIPTNFEYYVPNKSLNQAMHDFGNTFRG